MNIGILPRWAAGYLAVFLLLVASNLYAVLKLHQLGTTTIPRLNADIRIIDCQRSLIDSLLSQLRYERKYVLMKDAATYNQFLEARNEFHEYLAEGISIADTQAKMDFLKTVEEYQRRYESLVAEESEHLREKRSYVESRYRQEKDTISDAILEELKNLERHTREDVEARMRMVTEAGVSSLSIAFGSSLVSLLCALLISLYITRSITGPLSKLVNKTREISAGIFKSDLDISSPPEISELSKAFNAMCEKLTEVDRMKSDFLSMTSHELRTPLTTIKEGGSLLLEGVCGDITEKQKKLLTILSAETNRLIDMVNSILDLSKMEAGMMTYTFENGSITPLIDQAMTEITPLVEAKKIRLDKEIIGPVPLCTMDKERILQVLRNLIANAARFTPEQGRIQVSAKGRNGGVEVSVEDTGSGIPREKQATVFEKFSGSDHKRGTGLGLAIVKHIVTVHGGRVWVESEPGHGSRFIFVLPQGNTA